MIDTVKIATIQGHPDGRGGHFCHALAAAYEDGAAASGHEVRRIEVAKLDFPLLAGRDDWESGALPASLAEAQDTIAWADHLLIVYPLWLGTMPALLKAFFEQLFRPGFAFDAGTGKRWRKQLIGKSARVVVTMGMPATVYRWYFGAHSLKSLERNILRFVGIKPVRATLIGLVEQGQRKRERWLERLRRLGERAR
jgi:putative NADPH-quinone reductase